ncbi:Qat anti-phage system TatD family nuclease QatD [Roseovarius sp. 2305UL8-3]|uniref:Qat anti-phage system TatD family nuclease QatD n=1 Tax=Roseovarius conchicola TaxID=3121636 RepID=UPI003527BF88
MAADDGLGPVDFHCHLDLCEDMQKAYTDCDRMRCITLAVTTTPKAFGRNDAMAKRTSHIHAALGLHPQLVAQRSAEITLFEDFAATSRFIGEIGLDAGRQFYPSFDRQKQVFERALTVCANLGDKVISLHSVRAAKHVLDALERTGAYRTCRPVLHWFSASDAEIRRALDLGCLFSVNEQMLLSPRGKALLGVVPIKRLLTETDAPFQASPTDTKISPGDIASVTRLIAEAYCKDREWVKRQIRQTAMALISN